MDNMPLSVLTSTYHSMRNNHATHSLRVLFLILCLVIWLTPSLSWGEDDEDTIALFSAFQDQSSSSSRVVKPLSQTAENVTVITAADIRALNAHTLADVLATIPGVQTEHLGGAGGIVFVSMAGSSRNFHILVMVDGVPLNTVGENFSDAGMVPARIIERIEIIKGAASSSWGQALGGVINVITKSPEKRTIGGAYAVSFGEKSTSDDSIEFSGTNSRLGYYLTGGFLGSKDIPAHISTFSNNAYAKLTYDLPGQGQMWGTFSQSNADRTNLFVPSFDLQEDQKATYRYASLGMRRKLTGQLELELAGRHAYRAFNTVDTNISDGALMSDPFRTREKVYGASAKLVWRGGDNLLVAGGDYDHAKFAATGTQQDPINLVAKSLDRWGLYLNDTFTYGDLTLIPSVRFDRQSGSTDQFSPSLGGTYSLGERTLLRGYMARGYSIWAVTFVKPPLEKVWTSQIGIESSIVPYLWQKLTLFRNEVWDIGSALDRQITLGTEYEIRTTPVFNTSIGAGYTFSDTKLKGTGTTVPGVPTHNVQLALRYDDATFRGSLTGRHIFWNADPASNGSYNGLIWDLHLGAMLDKHENSSLELFFSGHNLFNGSQTNNEFLPWPGRWFEGGVRVSF